MRLAVDVDLEVGLADDAVGDDRRRLRRSGPPSGGVSISKADLLDRLEVGSLDLDAHRRAHAALQHDDARGDRLQLAARRSCRGSAPASTISFQMSSGFSMSGHAAAWIQLRVQRRTPLAEGHAVGSGISRPLVAREMALHAVGLPSRPAAACRHVAKQSTSSASNRNVRRCRSCRRRTRACS